MCLFVLVIVVVFIMCLNRLAYVAFNVCVLAIDIHIRDIAESMVLWTPVKVMTCRHTGIV